MKHVLARLRRRVVQVHQRNGVLSQLLMEAQQKLEDADVLVSTLQQQVEVWKLVW